MECQYTGVFLTYTRVEKYKWLEVKVSFKTITLRSFFCNNILLQCQLVVPSLVLTRCIQLETTVHQSSKQSYYLVFTLVIQ